MKNNKGFYYDWIFGIRRMIYMLGYFIFLWGALGYWLNFEPIFCVYLLLVGIGIIIICNQQENFLQLFRVIRIVNINRENRRKRKRTKKIEQEEEQQ